MNNAVRILPALLLALVLFCHPVVSGESPPIAPRTQPLLVVRAGEAQTFQRLLETRQAKALGLDRKDFSGRIPGLNAELDSLHTFLAALADADAKNLWYCLSQQGSSLVNQIGAIGWDAPDDTPDTPLPELVRRLAGMGLDAGGADAERRSLSSGASRIVIHPGGDARKEIFGGGGTSGDGWRGAMAEFLAGRQHDSVGVWANTRPLLGMLSLLSGIDFRAAMQTRNLKSPVWTQVELFNRQGDLGFEARVNNILPRSAGNADSPPVLIRSRDHPILEVNFPAAAGLWEVLVPETPDLSLANINIAVMIPQSVAVTVRRGGHGGYAVDVACLMPDKARFAEQFARLRAWLEFLAAASPAVFGVEEIHSPRGDALWNIRAGGASLVMGMADAGAGGGGALLIIAPDVADWPDPADREIVAGDAPGLAQWRARLDPASRADLTDCLARLSRRRGAEEFTASFWDAMLPAADAGGVAVENNALVVRSDSGLLPLLIPGVMDLFNHTYAQRDNQRVF